MPSKANRLITAGILALIILLLLSFLYGAYVNVFEPQFVAAVATSALVLVTTVSVIMTQSLLNEQKLARRQDIKPSFNILVKAISLGEAGIGLKNVGNGTAKNIEGEITVQPQGAVADFYYSSVPPGQLLPIGNPFDDISLTQDDEDYDKIIAEGTYEDIMGNEWDFKIEESYKKNTIEEYMMKDQSIEESLDDIADEMSDVTSELRDIEREFGRNF